MSRNKIPVADRLWKKVVKSIEPGGCWNWTGAKSGGYGYINAGDGSGNLRVHRVAWELMVGPIPEGMVLDHICHNKACVRPEHLRVVTQKANCQNRAGAQANSTTGVRGVFRHRNGKYRVLVGSNGRLHHGGYFDTIEAADRAARYLRLRLFTHSDMDRNIQDDNNIQAVTA